MSNPENPIINLPLKFLFLVWGTPDQGPRSRIMADKLGFDVYFIATTLPRGALYIPIKYPIQAIRTMFLLFSKRPDVVFVQNPPLLTVFFTYIYCFLTGAKFIIDAHSEALLSRGPTAPPNWIKRFLAKRAITTLVTNEYLQEMVDNLGGHSLILRDIPTVFQTSGEYPLEGDFNIALINTFAADEPLQEVLQAAADLPDVHFYVTGKLKQSNAAIVNGKSANVHFTNFLPDQDFYNLLNTAHAVMCLTTRNHTMQRGACEALSLGKPIITSNWPILSLYFNKGTVHVDNSVEDIRRGILEMKEQLNSFEQGIKELQIDQQREWQQNINTLASLIVAKFPRAQQVQNIG